MKIRIRANLQHLLKTYNVLSTALCGENVKDIFDPFSEFLCGRDILSPKLMCKSREMNEKLMNYVKY